MALDVARKLRDRLPQVALVMRRFPLAVLAAALLTAYHFFEVHRIHAPGNPILQLWITAALSAAFLWSLGAALAAEQRGLSERAKLGLGALGFAFFGLLYLRTTAMEVEWPLLVAALAIGLSVAPYLIGGMRNGEIWQFNHHLWIGWCVAVIAMMLFAGGISIIIETLRYLFSLPIPHRLHEKVWTVACGFVAPVYWLSMVPSNLAEKVPEGEQSEFTSKSVAALVRFILVPLLLIYGAILHVYVIKVLFDQALPKNQIGKLVLSFGAVMAVTALAAYPTREAGGRIVALFWRIWPWLLTLPTAMLFLAIGIRIRQHGLTAERYLVVLAGLWMVGLMVSQGLLAKRRDLRLITGSLAALLAFAAIGPLGMAGWSVRNQAQTLIGKLTAAGVVKDGRVAAERPAGAVNLTAGDRAELHGIIDYLDSSGRLNVLRPLFAGHPSDPFQGRQDLLVPRNSDLSQAIRDRLALGARTTRPGEGRSLVTYQGQGAAAFSVEAGSELIGPVTLSLVQRQRASPVQVDAGLRKLSVHVEGSDLVVRDQRGRRIAFDLRTLLEPKGVLAQADADRGRKRTPLQISSQPPADGATLLLTSVNAQLGDDGSYKPTYLAFWLVLRRE